MGHSFYKVIGSAICAQHTFIHRRPVARDVSRSSHSCLIHVRETLEGSIESLLPSPGYKLINFRAC